MRRRRLNAQGTGVSFYLGDKDALTLFNSGSHVELSAPTTGAMAGVLLFADRDIAEYTYHEINSDSTSQLNGTVYMPNSELIINSIGRMGSPGSCTNYLVGNAVVNSDSELYVGQNWAGCGVPIPGAYSTANIRLVR